MKKFYIFLMIILCISCTPKKYMYTYIDSSLNLREEPNLTSQVILSIPPKEKVEIITEGKELSEFDGLKSNWVLVKYKKETGWLFKGFLSNTVNSNFIFFNESDFRKIKKELGKLKFDETNKKISYRYEKKINNEIGYIKFVKFTDTDFLEKINYEEYEKEINYKKQKKEYSSYDMLLTGTNDHCSLLKRKNKFEIINVNGNAIEKAAPWIFEPAGSIHLEYIYFINNIKVIVGYEFFYPSSDCFSIDYENFVPLKSKKGNDFIVNFEKFLGNNVSAINSIVKK